MNNLKGQEFTFYAAAWPSANCGCNRCSDFMRRSTVMILCPRCGNKRCPLANDHRNECTGSNDAGQPGSAYP